MGEWWEYSCFCGLSGWGPSPDAAKKEFKSKDTSLKLKAIKKKQENGETPSYEEYRLLQYSRAGSCFRC